ncbi:multidrug effflux MFS transporter [Cellulomonas soli]|uniref:Bcr/CflA family drug resistance efflux transporter n=1 Tax=Cellulomonas soli TaxID=931535 RepID=A0A512PFN1_9CELL|nr:multidrug effflux MFS transporter [Cellulomonas soli]NYI59851.1 DHA1 family bicyclomycin/chloramphenicol resistance-like MFS transporter [Cellulomonas soli]GEP70005.1 Bcr/CflA family drug resistance efflux transporter [Cellulomonas soli]
MSTPTEHPDPRSATPGATSDTLTDGTTNDPTSSVTSSAAPTAPVVPDAAAPRSLTKYVLLLGSMCALPAISTDIYLPSLPEVAHDLGTTATAAQLTMTGMLIGAAAGQLVIGPTSDRFGRRRPVLVGVAAHVVTSLLCMVAPTIGLLIGLRTAQGFFNASASVVAMAVIRDRFVGSTASRLLSRLMLVIGVAPLFAPSIGGLIAGQAGWRAVFGALALFGAGLWVVVWRRLPETLPADRRRHGGLRTALGGYRRLVTDRHFVALALLPSLGVAVLMSYVVASPFVLREGYGLSAAQFSLLFAVNGLGLVGGAQVNAALVRRVSPIRIVRVVQPLSVTLTLLLLVLALTGAGGLPALLVVLWGILALVNFVPPNASALALSRHGQIAGTAAAFIGALQSGVSGVISPVSGLLGGDAVAMAVVMVAAATGGLLVLALATPAYRRGGAWTGQI